MSQRISRVATAAQSPGSREEPSTWQGRRKHPLRRLRNDLRLAAPAIAIGVCFGLSASAIFATDWLPTPVESAWLARTKAVATRALPAVSAAGETAAACDRETKTSSGVRAKAAQSVDAD